MGGRSPWPRAQAMRATGTTTITSVATPASTQGPGTSSRATPITASAAATSHGTPAAAARGPRAQAPGEVGIGGRLVRGELRQGLPLAVGERAGTGLGQAFHGGTSVRDDVGVERH